MVSIDGAWCVAGTVAAVCALATPAATPSSSVAIEALRMMRITPPDDDLHPNLARLVVNGARGFDDVRPVPRLKLDVGRNAVRGAEGASDATRQETNRKVITGPKIFRFRIFRSAPCPLS